ncbi:BTB/POZ domain-containing protein [Ditylenchus destructor]|nr:BTB/POZ domain-containing protein [Ditylenchus destructor]
MSQDSFIFNFNVKAFESGQDFPKSNVVELEGSKWYLGIEKKASNDRISLSYWKILDICLSCERGTPSGIYLVNLALILRGSLIDVLFTRTYYFKPLDLEMHCFKIDYNYLLDNDNGFIDENGEGKIMAEISVKRVDDKEILELDINQQELSTCPQELNGIINLQGGHRMFVNKELLSRHSKYFDTIFNNENFVESSQESIDLTDFTYNQFRLLHKHIYETHPQFTDGSLEFRLKSEDGVKEFQRLRTLADVRKCLGFTNFLLKTEYAGKNLLKETLCMFDDSKQMGAVTGLIFCVFTDCWRREDRTVSAENIEDLLSVGSYFQISKIVDSCKEFLSRNSFYSDFSVRRRMELAEKYNLPSVTVPDINPVNPLKHQWNTDSARLTPIVLVQLTFLDTGKEKEVSVKFIDGMTIQTLFSNALAIICLGLGLRRVSSADWFDPLGYKVENVHISDLETRSEVKYQSKDIEDNPALMIDYAHSSRIYSFKVQRIRNKSIGIDDISPSTSSATEQQLPKVRSLEISDTQRVLPGKSSAVIAVYITFLDTGVNEMCAVQYQDGMSIQWLFFHALSSLHSKNKSSSPLDYKLERVGVSNPGSTPGGQAETSFLNFEGVMFGQVFTSEIYKFEVRLKTEENYLGSKEMPTTSKMPPTEVPKVDRMPTEILVVLNFLDINDQEICTVPYKAGMSVQKLLFIAFLTLKDSRSPWEYEIESVYVSDSYSTSDIESHSLRLQDIEAISVNSSYAYNFLMRRKTDEPSTSKEKQ